MVGGLHHRKHLDFGEGSLTPALVVERADPDQPVRALLDGQRAVGVRRMHRERRALDARLFGVGGVEDLDAVLVLLGPADVHPHQHLGPVGGVHPAGAGANGDQRLALVVLARQQRANLGDLYVGAQRLEFGVGLGQGFDPAGRTPFFGRQNNAKIGHARDDQVSQIAKRFVVIERASQDVARIRQKGQPLLARFRFRPRRLLSNQFLPLLRLAFYLFGFFEQIDKDRDLGPQNFRHDRRENVIDRA